MHLHGDHLGSISVVTDYMGAQGKPEQQEFDPWGEVRNPPGQPVNSTSLNYTGQVLDGTGLLFYHARYYDPLIGRFISPDPIVPGEEDAKGGAGATVGAILNHKLTVDFHNPQFVAAMQQEDGNQKEKQTQDADEKGSDSDQWGPSNPQTLNRYAYVLNNPVRYTDPTGHIAFLAILAIAALGYGSSVAVDVGIDYVTAEDKSKFDVGASAANSSTDPWSFVGMLPVVGLAGKAAKGVKAVGKIASKATSASTSIGQSARIGKAGEIAAGISGTAKKRAIPSMSGSAVRRYPEHINDQYKTLTEVKNVKRLGYTKQLKDDVTWAKANGYKVRLIVRKARLGRPGTYLTGPLKQAIKRRDIYLKRRNLP